MWHLRPVPGRAANEPWREANSQLEKKHNIKMRSRRPGDGRAAGASGQGQPMSAYPKVTLAPGVTASLAWSKGALLEALEMEKDAAYPSQQLNEEVITVVREGSATCEVGGKTVELAADSVLYLTPGDDPDPQGRAGRHEGAGSLLAGARGSVEAGRRQPCRTAPRSASRTRASSLPDCPVRSTA